MYIPRDTSLEGREIGGRYIRIYATIIESECLWCNILRGIFDLYEHIGGDSIIFYDLDHSSLIDLPDDVIFGEE